MINCLLPSKKLRKLVWVAFMVLVRYWETVAIKASTQTALT